MMTNEMNPSDKQHWNTFQKYALHNPNIKDFSQFFDLMHKIENRIPFHIARYNDGVGFFTAIRTQFLYVHY